MQRLTPILLLSLALGLLAAGCGDDEEKDEDSGKQQSTETEHGLTEKQASQVLVKVGEHTITVGEFADRLADQSPYLRARYNSPERRREFLDNMIRFELLAAEAERRGLTDLPEVQRSVKQVMIQQMMKDLFEDEIQLSDITDEEIEKYYEEHRSEFNKPEQVRASHILVSSRAQGARILRQLKESPNDVSLFRKLAAEHTADEDTKDRFGDLRFFSKPGEGAEEEEEEEESADVPDAVAEAAFEIERIGGIYPELVKSDEGWHIVKLTGRRAALERSIEEARRPIQNRLWRDKREKSVDDFVNGLREDAKVEENFEVLDEIELDLPEGDSPTAEVPQAPTKGPGKQAPPGPGSKQKAPSKQGQ